MDLAFIKRALRVATAGTLGLAISGSVSAGLPHLCKECGLCEEKRNQISPACHSTWGFHQTCWRRFPQMAPCPCENGHGAASSFGVHAPEPIAAENGRPMSVVPDVPPGSFTMPSVVMPGGSSQHPTAPPSIPPSPGIEDDQMPDPGTDPTLPTPSGDAPMLPPDRDQSGGGPAGTDEVIPESLKRFLRKTTEPEGGQGSESDAAPEVAPDEATEPVGGWTPGFSHRGQYTAASQPGWQQPVIAPLLVERERPDQAVQSVSESRTVAPTPTRPVLPGYPQIAPLPPSVNKPVPAPRRRPETAEQPKPEVPQRNKVRLAAPDLKKPSMSAFRRISRTASGEAADNGLQIAPR